MKFKTIPFVKFIAVLLFTAAMLAFIASVAGAAVLYDAHGYAEDRETVLYNYLDTRGRQMTLMTREALIHAVSPENVNHDGAFRFRLVDEKGKSVYDNLGDLDAIWQGDCRYSVYYLPDSDTVISDVAYTEDIATETSGEAIEAVKCTVRGYILGDSSGYSQLMIGYRLLSYIYSYKDALVVSMIVNLLLAIGFLILLLSAAGYKRDGTLKASAVEKIPFDIFTLICFTGVCSMIALAIECTNGNEWINSLVLCVMTMCIVFAVLIALLWSASLAVRVKLGITVKGSICYKVISFFLRAFKQLWLVLSETLKNIPMFPRTLLITAAVLLIEFLWTISVNNRGQLLFGWFVERAVLVVGLVYALWCMNRLLEAGKELATGKTELDLDMTKLKGAFKSHAEDLNSVTEGMNRAINERMKAERFRTELITNVSHDIKTPLTSIISYVDLLEKEKPESENMREYIDVLSRQSAKLKKLIDDLLEASKASTGNINVRMERCELGVLLTQCVGEYTEKLEDSGLSLIVTRPEEDVYIMADGRHMWRIFENLMSNIKKYAQSGTRVYIDLVSDEKKASVIFRNISERRLNISGEELTERFVRGESSRSGEGSGLGLNIAQSLTALQNGEMKVTVDGDLFKVSLEFNRLLG